MIHELSALLSVSLRELLGFNRYRHSTDNKYKRRYRLSAVVWSILLLYLLFYIGGLVYALCVTGAENTVPTVLCAMASLVVFFLGLFRGSRLFERKGYDVLASLPIRKSSLVLGRFLMLYLEDLLLTLVILLPGSTVYAFLALPSPFFYAVTPIGILLLPLIPLVLSCALGTGITALSSRMRQKSMVQTLLSLALVISVLVGSLSVGGFAEELSPEALKTLLASLSDRLCSLYPPADWLGKAMLGESPLGLLRFAALSLGGAALLLALVIRFFSPVMHALGNVAATQNYTHTGLRTQGLLRALFHREVKRYVSSSIYVTNTAVGPIMGLLMAITLLLFREDITTVVRLDITPFAPILLSAVFCMMTTTSSSISMEGKQISLIKSLPIPTKTWLDAKLLLNLSLMLPFFLVSELLLIIALAPNPRELLSLVLLPIAVILFSVVLGITVNLKMHSFDWEKEEWVIKQSAPSMLGGFAGFFWSLLLGGAVYLTPEDARWLAGLILALITLLITWSLYRKNNQASITAL